MLAFVLCTWQVLVHGPLLRVDERVDGHVVGRGPQGVAEVLSDLGSVPVALPVLALVLGYAVWRGAWRRALAGAVAMALVPALVVPLKIWTARPGPLDPSTGYYPSGHTATAMAAYGAAALVLAPYCGRYKAVPGAAAAVLTVATAVGLVLHGYHWPLDVVASGALCGALLLVLSAVLTRLPDGRSAPRAAVEAGGDSGTPPGPEPRPHR